MANKKRTLLHADHHRRPSSLSTTNCAPLDPLVRLWCLRLLVLENGHQLFVERAGFTFRSLATALGLAHWVDVPASNFDAKAVRSELQDLHRKAERRVRQPLPSLLERNLRRLQQLVGLDDGECCVLAFVIYLAIDSRLRDATRSLPRAQDDALHKQLASVLDVRDVAIRHALSPKGNLIRAGLIQLSNFPGLHISEQLELPSPSFAATMFDPDMVPTDLLHGLVNPSPPPTLTLADYPHLSDALEVLRPYLARVAVAGRSGVNILLYGRAGTGKTQFVRALAHELGCDMYEVASTDETDAPMGGAARLQAVRAGQHFLSPRGTLLLFDEAEDVFCDQTLTQASTTKTSKASTNDMLESNPVPTLWLSNVVHGIDPAFIRRFDMVIEIPIPPRKERERIVRRLCGDLVDGPLLQRLAESDALSPAVIARAGDVVRAIGDALDAEAASKAVGWLVANTLKAQAKHSPGSVLRAGGPMDYDPALLRTDADLATIARALTASPSARLCLYGPPGTGKSAYARWLADELDKPLLVRRASDLLGPFVGETEQRVARTFERAARDDALLLIDEVDSFLRNREHAQRSWETTMVNELLTQMEAFNGVLVVTTNMMDRLDPAAMRRFDLKVKFDYLDAGQVLELLRRCGIQIGLAMPDTIATDMVSHLRHLTPGDFAVVVRQHRFRPMADWRAFLDALKVENDLKAAARPRIGFVA